MNKNAIKKFAIEARKKLIDSVTDKAGMLGITKKSCSEPIAKGADFEVYQTTAGTEVTLNKRQCEQRRRLVSQIETRGFEAVVEEVAYTWFNRICAIRFMEVNDYLPNRVRVLSSEKEGKLEPDLVTLAPDVDLDLTAQEKEEIISWKMSGTSEDTDKLYCKLFLKQCHQLHTILPGLFEADSDYMELLFGISYTNKDDVIYMLVNPETGIPEVDFNVSTLDEEGNPTGQVEIIGWLYQYYNTELKDDTFAKLKKNIKITKERIPAATQLFTPHWIVRYMVENSVGRIWIEHLRAVDPNTDEKVAAENFGWKYYLPEAEQEEAVNVKLAEIRTAYKDLKPMDITCIDPCMGSGHILITMFDVLMDIYESAGYDKREAAFEIVEHNLHGLDIDQRAYQLAYFAVMMKGRGYNRRFLRGRDGKPEPKVYAIVESNEINRNHLQFFGTHLSERERDLAVAQMEGLLDTFKDAREYGSILNIDHCDWDVLEKFVEDLDADGQISFESVGSEETQKNLRKLVRVAKNLGQKYDAVVTNPPYMGGGNMDAQLSEFVKKHYPDSKSDQFAVFIERCCQMIGKNRYQAMITQHAWMFLSSFEKLRAKLLLKDTVNMAHLGPRAFDEIGGEVVQTTSFVLRNSHIVDYKGTYCRLIEPTTQQGKEELFLAGENRHIAQQSNFSDIPGSPVAYWVSDVLPNIYASANKLKILGRVTLGMRTGDNERFLRLWHEISRQKFCYSALSAKAAQESGARWFPYNKGGEFRKWYGNTENVVNWENNGFDIKENTRRVYPQLGDNLSWKITSEDKYFTKGIAWSRISSANFGVRLCDSNLIFDTNAPMFFPDCEDWLEYIAGFMCSKIASNILQILNPTLTFQVVDVGNLPIILNEKYRLQVKQIAIDCVRLSKADWDSSETSWDFRWHSFLRQVSHLADAYAAWKVECEQRFLRLKTNEEELNRIFIDIYGLQNELTSDVADKGVTVHRIFDTKDEVPETMQGSSYVRTKRDEIVSLLSYAVGCMFGRYTLDKKGLIFAGGEFSEHYQKVDCVLATKDGRVLTTAEGRPLKAKEQYGKIKVGNEWKDVSFAPDLDNCLPITDEEYFSDDIVSRFVEFVKTVYGADTLEENLDFVARALGNKGDTSREVIRNYFLKDFYADHLKVYQKRPIYWMFDSGKENGFKALIYMHRYNADTVGRVRIDYLHRAQKYVETAMQSAQYTIENAASASEKSKATKAVTKYTKQLAEMKIYDEAIAHIANQRIEIDLDDGVKVNYAKFQGVEVAQEGKKALKVDLLAKIK